MCSQPLLLILGLSSSRWAVGGATVASQVSFNAAVQDGATWSCYQKVQVNQHKQRVCEQYNEQMWQIRISSLLIGPHIACVFVCCYHHCFSGAEDYCCCWYLISKSLPLLSKSLSTAWTFPSTSSLKLIFSIFFYSGISEIPYKNRLMET